ncbi:MAG: hypothetical protein AAB368_07845, partial [bacterium]
GATTTFIGNTAQPAALAVGAGGGGAAGDSPLALLWAFVVGGFVSSLAAGALVFGGVWGWLTVRRRPA